MSEFIVCNSSTLSTSFFRTGIFDIYGTFIRHVSVKGSIDQDGEARRVC